MAEATKTQAQQLAARFESFNQQLLTFVQACDSDDWKKITPAEQWPVGVTARHIGVGHYPLVGWVEMIVEGQPLPDIIMEEVNQMNDQHAIDHADCSSAEVIEILENNSTMALEYLATLSDADLEREGYLGLFDESMSAGKLFTVLLIDIADAHFQSMKAALDT
jgi:hypothetical protein